MSEPPIQLAAIPLFTLHAETGERHVVPGAAFGDRVMIAVTGGSFAGARIAGTVLPSGADWLALAEGVARIDARLALRTDDGTVILLAYSGVGRQQGGEPTARVSGRFEAPAGPHHWLNEVHAIGLGTARDGIANYDFYQLA